MKAIFLIKSGELKIEEVPDPDLNDDEVLIKVKATVVNGSDITERKKFYGERLCLGLECSGTIEKMGKDVKNWNINDEVCAVLSSGGYAEKVAVPELQVFPVPAGVTVDNAASLPYAACTVWSNLFTTNELAPLTFWLPKVGGKPRLSAGETLLNCQSPNVSNAGVDVILNVLGPEYHQRNLSCLNKAGRLISIGNFCLNKVDTASSLPNSVDESKPRKFIRSCAFQHRSKESKELIVKEVREKVWYNIENHRLEPSFPSKTFTFSEVEKAHELMETGQHFGKILLVPADNA